MKKTLVIVGLAVLSTSAHATKARIEALGTNANLYMKDSRNVFRNAATINSNKNYIVTEWGQAVKSDVVGTPRAEGGFFREMGSFAYGLYLGDEGSKNATREDAAVTPGYLAQDNALDLFIGGDAGLQWGAQLHYANSSSETAVAEAKRTNSAFGLGLGMVMGEMEAYANVDLSDKSKGDGTTAANEASRKPSFTIGGAYNWSGYTFFAEVVSGKSEVKEGTETATDKDFNVLVGAGRVMEINPTARVFGNAAVSMTKNETNDGANPATTNKTTNTIMPLTFGFETDATSWLALRGSLSQNVLLNNKKVEAKAGAAAGTTTKTTNAATTTVNAGASLTFGKLALDGSIGVMGTGTLNTDNLMSRVGVIYNF
ncbi:MAG: hypothetical protein EHM20_02805 [Alphaproteobacteria bacterium]|nr:MAG: hypothetical protein EHM20_02805 [Alphaproteobacteria bacterium]